MNKRILFVDDEAHLLSSVARQLGDLYDLTTATGGAEGIRIVETSEEFAAVVADMRMPGMDGVQFLASVRELSPNSIRMMLTGNADHQTAVKAVNEGHVFRFLNKPATRLALVSAIDDCLAQHRLLAAEKELLEKTLTGSIKVLVEILATVDPALFGKAQSLKANAAMIAIALNAPEVWQVELAAMLCQIGLVAAPNAAPRRDPKVIRLHDPSAKASSRLPQAPADVSERIPLIGYSLINKIPRLEGVAEAILYQDQRFDGTGFPGDGRQGRFLPLGARILKVLRDLDELRDSGRSIPYAIAQMRGRKGWYDPIVLQLAAEFIGGQPRPREGMPVTIADLAAGDSLGSDIFTVDGVLLLSAGHVVSDVSLARIGTYVGMHLIDETDVVYVAGRLAEAA